MTTRHYCTIDDVTSLFDVNISDSLEKENLINVAIENATARIHSKLRANRVPLPDLTNISSTIKTIAIYFAICDLYGSLYSGSDYEEQKNFWCKTASELLDDYIKAFENSCAEDLEQYALYGHSNAQTYKERKYGHRNRRDY